MVKWRKRWGRDEDRPATSKLRVHVTSQGGRYIDARELIASAPAQEQIRKVNELLGDAELPVVLSARSSNDTGTESDQ